MTDISQLDPSRIYLINPQQISVTSKASADLENFNMCEITSMGKSPKMTTYWNGSDDLYLVLSSWCGSKLAEMLLFRRYTSLFIVSHKMPTVCIIRQRVTLLKIKI